MVVCLSEQSIQWEVSWDCLIVEIITVGNASGAIVVESGKFLVDLSTKT